jgi:hypothetical protein
MYCPHPAALLYIEVLCIVLTPQRSGDAPIRALLPLKHQARRVDSAHARVYRCKKTHRKFSQNAKARFFPVSSQRKAAMMFG